MSWSDIIARIDQVIAELDVHCWQCKRHLDGATENGFCSERCQDLWHATQLNKLRWDYTTDQRALRESIYQRLGEPMRLDTVPVEFELQTARRNGKSSALLRRTWSCEVRGHLWQMGAAHHAARCAACGHALTPWWRRRLLHLRITWCWWRGTLWRVTRPIHRRSPEATVTDPRALLDAYAAEYGDPEGECAHDCDDDRGRIAPKAFAVVRAVLDLHPEAVLADYDEHICLHCSDDRQHNVPWPCPTVDAVTTALETT